MNVVIYCRVSGQAQIEGDGFDRQSGACLAFADKHGLQVSILPFHEKAVSGTVEGMDRPVLSQILADVGAGKLQIGAVIVERMDRLARDLMVQEFILAEFRKCGLQLFSADQGVLVNMASNDGDPTRKLIRQILGALAEWEKSMLVCKLGGARARMRERTGRCEGVKPYGELPGEAGMLKALLALIEANVGKISWRRIALWVQYNGFKTRKGTDWDAAALHRLWKTHQKKGMP